MVRPREDVGRGPRRQKGSHERTHETEPCRGLPQQLHPSATTPPSPLLAPGLERSGCVRRCAKAAPRTTEAKEETKKEAQDKMPAREPIRMRRAKTWDVEVENAYRFQCAGWRSAVRAGVPRCCGAFTRPAQEEYAQGEYGDEISWFSDSGLVEKVQNRQGLFMYFKRSVSVSAALPV